MKALSIQQPWAWLIASGYKDIENRDWKYEPSYRGQLLIHASKNFDFNGYHWVRSNFPEIQLPEAKKHKVRSTSFDKGGFVGLCRLNDVVDMDDSPWFFGPLGFKIRMPKLIKFIPYPGQLGLFNVPDSIIKQIEIK